MNNPQRKGSFDASRAVWRGADSPTRLPSTDQDGGPAGDDSSAGNVEVAFVDDLIGLRDSRRPDGPILVFTQREWEAFLAGAKDGEFDL